MSDMNILLCTTVTVVDALSKIYNEYYYMHWIKTPLSPTSFESH